MEPPERNWLKAEKGLMNALHLFFAFLYGWAPLLLVPFLAYHFDNWWLLFGILFSYAGGSGSLAIWFTVFIIGFWIKSGFDIHQYITFYYFCSLWGCLMFHWSQAYDAERRKGTSDSDEEKFKRWADEITPQTAQGIRDNQPEKTVTAVDPSEETADASAYSVTPAMNESIYTLTDKQVFTLVVRRSIKFVCVRSGVVLLIFIVGYFWPFGGLLLSWVAIADFALDVLLVTVGVALPHAMQFAILAAARVCNQRVRRRLSAYASGATLVRFGEAGIMCIYAYLLYLHFIK